MPKIETYNFDENISDNDFLLGTDGDEDNKTKSYKIRTLINKIKAEVELTAFIEVETLPIEDIQLNTIYILPNGDWNYYNGTIWLSNSNRPYKVYTALLTQSGTDAPVATVLENTLGEDITFSYESEGWYNVVSDGLFVENKTTCEISNTTQETYGYETIKRVSESIIRINSISSETIETMADAIIDNSKIEIRVYN